MDNEVTVSGHAFLGETLEDLPVMIVVKSGIITHIEHERHPGDNWICPAFFNAHTHLGDTIAMDVPTGGDLVATVTPPDGLKHRLLAGTPYPDLVAGMRSSIRVMTGSGTAGCADFREGGPVGVRALKEAAGHMVPGMLILGREGGETGADGIGISSARDVEGLETLVARAKEHRQLVAFHAGEKDDLDVETALSFDPDLLIHCTYASHRQLRECAERDIPVVMCPRSNWAFGLAKSSEKPPFHDLMSLGGTFLLGTDNVMIAQPDMFAELAFCSFIYTIPHLRLLDAAIRGSELLQENFFIRKGSPARFFVLNPGNSNMRFSHDRCATLIKRGSSREIVKKVFISKR